MSIPVETEIVSESDKPFLVAMAMIVVLIVAMVMIFIGWYSGKTDSIEMGALLLTPIVAIVSSIASFYFGQKVVSSLRK